MGALSFVKMHGLGNDFVVIDARLNLFAPDAAGVRAVADRRTGVGCDQLIVVEPPRNPLADAFMRIRNADGGEVAACGNATRCVAALLMREKGGTHAIVETTAGLLDAEHGDVGLSASKGVGPVSFDWRDILSPWRPTPCTCRCRSGRSPTASGSASAIRTPCSSPPMPAPLRSTVSPLVERHLLFPSDQRRARSSAGSRPAAAARLGTRGAGLTSACGTGACAAAAAATRRGLTDRTRRRRRTTAAAACTSNGCAMTTC
ncbi:MAG: diaminopimelate epimerase [Rhodospirillales bacterium]